MPHLKFVPALLLTLFATLPPGAMAQGYPAKSIRMVVPYPAGGGLDVLARQLGERVGRHLGQSMVIDNRPGAGTIIGADAVAKAAPDGYTLMITADTTITLNQSLYSKLPYEPVKDFAPVTQLVLLNQMLIVSPAVPANNLKELIAYAKANPGKLNYASYGSGTPPHLAMETLKNLSGVAITHVPYKGLAQAVPAVLADEVQMTFSGAASSMALIKSGRLRALAIGGRSRLGLLPEVPTFAELGYAEVPASTWFGLFAPAGTPRDIVGKLHDEFKAAITDPEFAQKEVAAKGFELVANTPEEFAGVIAAEIPRNAKAVKISGAKAE
ncbi:MAG TPA: tripartite tricarboxylate transporter substrate binding protein [Burkholderiales bacterium]|jgi:tripartite-type tricarboxylate transporter receptor subunit TctC|nr:tripartite tricarboxylate transporter substrate binding protein [Burkholderiales bacterium]